MALLLLHTFISKLRKLPQMRITWAEPEPDDVLCMLCLLQHPATSIPAA